MIINKKKKNSPCKFVWFSLPVDCWLISGDAVCAVCAICVFIVDYCCLSLLSGAICAVIEFGEVGAVLSSPDPRFSKMQQFINSIVNTNTNTNTNTINSIVNTTIVIIIS